MGNPDKIPMYPRHLSPREIAQQGNSTPKMRKVAVSERKYWENVRKQSLSKEAYAFIELKKFVSSFVEKLRFLKLIK